MSVKDIIWFIEQRLEKVLNDTICNITKIY